MAVLTVHHWRDPVAGIAEMRRVARRVVVLTWDQGVIERFWLVRDYLPELAVHDRGREVPIATLLSLLGPGAGEVIVPIPHDCTDGFLGAYWRRPAAYLDARVRGAISSLAALGAGAEPGLSRLRSDLATGAWAAGNPGLAGLQELDLGYRLLVAG